MKKIVYLIASMLILGNIVNAQTKDSTRYQKDKERFKNMDTTQKEKLRDEGVTKDLNLSNQQKKQMDDIHTETRKQKEQIENDNSLTQAQKDQKIKDLKKQEKSKMNTTLTPEQREKAKQTRENQKKKESKSQ